MNNHPTNVAAIAIEQALANTNADKRIEVLRAIGRFGSISQAARTNGVSYKAAWQAIETLTNLAGTALLEKVVGGAGGGGARLTAAGEALLLAADHLSQARARALAEIAGRATESAKPLSNLASLDLRTSMRNQLPCVVSAIETPRGAPRVWLQLSDGQRLSSRITRESLELLDLQIGMPVLALCKATAVTIAPTIVAVGEVNLLKGHVAKRLGIKSDGQVSMAIGNGLQIAGFVGDGVALKMKQAATAAVAESALVIGLTS